MTPEERSLLERTYKLSEENNGILRSMRRANRWTTAFHIGYWVVIILLSVGALYFIKPYLTAISGMYDQGQESLSNMQEAANTFRDLLK